MARAKTKYQVVEAQHREQLEEKVMELLAEGWELQGGVSGAWGQMTGWWYFQALLIHEVA